jgi:hypothetical protein
MPATPTSWPSRSARTVNVEADRAGDMEPVDKAPKFLANQEGNSLAFQ